MNPYVSKMNSKVINRFKKGYERIPNEDKTILNEKWNEAGFRNLN